MEKAKNGTQLVTEKYIKKHDLTWTYEDILKEHERYKNGEYISFTAKQVIHNCIDHRVRLYN